MEMLYFDISYGLFFISIHKDCIVVGTISFYITNSNIKYIDNQLVTVIKIQMICKCKYKTI